MILRPYCLAILFALVVVPLTPWKLIAQDSSGPSAQRQFPNMKSIPDSTTSLQDHINQFGSIPSYDKPTVLRITKPLIIDLTKLGAVKLQSNTGLTLLMDGPGPALRFLGSHDGTASPTSFVTETWHQRMPIVSGIEIVGNHPEAVGIELFKTVQPILTRVSVRWCLHGIHLVTRNRNVTISDCHLYENSGVGIFLDAVNLHQINISNTHISYNRQGGIVVRDGNVRNIQITGCDIEGNMPATTQATTTANILIDVSGTPDDKSQSVAEVAITGCTIQHSANYSKQKSVLNAPGGANIRLLGKEIWPIDSVTITGNLLSDTETSLDIRWAHDIAITGNSFFTPGADHVHLRKCQQIVFNGNTLNPRLFARPGGVRFFDCQDCIVSTSTIHQSTTPDGALSLENCQGFLINALRMTKGGSGIVLKKSNQITISNCRISDIAEGGKSVSIDSSNHNILLSANAFAGIVQISETATGD